MKKALLLVVSVICMVASFWVGRETANSDLKANADGILAYQHYYECAEGILKDVNVTDTALAKECDLARKELKDYLDGHVLTWPTVCDQRDKLSDIIRKYAKEENDNIMEYVKDYFENPSILDRWAYCY